ncbi:acetyl-CoA carboxylase biotin carboxyl carrier protein subunit [Lewinella sp. JB7]|uniref:acetyl-CoA carboxylase biotin carboxyl carrier protein subunit n=1 Tax=Lewinella sp. JB7 TaxID=2962887 RepID=UPI0020CA1DF4|nr:acetyl-CoA carboxylase biotin carboxyl carrier protein subunit [Lewinella sp. JB7]MCP9235279.1 acetyl-CoA carboxylase biotin carboxyl carrier protein subunit [Lewinella sp. JB7]
MQKYKAIIADHDYSVTDQQLAELDISGPFKNEFHLLHGSTGYTATVVEHDLSGKSLTVEINGRPFTVTIRDTYDQLVEELGFATVASSNNTDVLAPMPGLILDVLVQEGDEVAVGAPLLILEAMKMENVLKAEGTGTVKSIRVNKGQAVEKRQLLMEME